MGLVVGITSSPNLSEEEALLLSLLGVPAGGGAMAAVSAKKVDFCLSKEAGVKPKPFEFFAVDSCCSCSARSAADTSAAASLRDARSAALRTSPTKRGKASVGKRSTADDGAPVAAAGSSWSTADRGAAEPPAITGAKFARAKAVERKRSVTTAPTARADAATWFALRTALSNRFEKSSGGGAAGAAPETAAGE